MIDLGSSFLASTERNPKATAIAGNNFKHTYIESVSYTHLTLPTNREV